MKWKIYLLCSWYNIMMSAGFCCLFAYQFMREVSLNEIPDILIIIAILSGVTIKNRMDIKFYQGIKERQGQDRAIVLFSMAV
jgi:hypothetical protein